jgi:hypothetical protein
LNKLPSVEKFKDICENSVTEQEEYLKKKFNENIKEFEKSLKGK